MPIPFSTIPELLAISIVNKLDVYAFPLFSQSSCDAFDIVEKTRKPLTVSSKLCEIYQLEDTMMCLFFIEDERHIVHLERELDFPIQLIAKCLRFNLKLSLNEEMCDFLISTFTKTKSSVNEVMIDSVSCTADKFNLFLDALAIKKFTCAGTPVSTEYFTIPAIKNLDFIHVLGPFSDADLFSLQVPNVSMHKTKISSFAINKLLKECVSGKRKGDFTVSTTEELQQEEIFYEISYTEKISFSEAKKYYIENGAITITVTLNDNRYVSIITH